MSKLTVEYRLSFSVLHLRDTIRDMTGLGKATKANATHHVSNFHIITLTLPDYSFQPETQGNVKHNHDLFPCTVEKGVAPPGTGAKEEDPWAVKELVDNSPKWSGKFIMWS